MNVLSDLYRLWPSGACGPSRRRRALVKVSVVHRSTLETAYAVSDVARYCRDSQEV